MMEPVAYQKYRLDQLSGEATYSCAEPGVVDFQEKRAPNAKCCSETVFRVGY